MAEKEKKVLLSEQVGRPIRRLMRRKFSTDGNLRIALDGLHGKNNITDLFRREDIHPNQYYTGSKIPSIQVRNTF